jgi:hypothetical protein
MRRVDGLSLAHGLDLTGAGGGAATAGHTTSSQQQQLSSLPVAGNLKKDDHHVTNSCERHPGHSRFGANDVRRGAVWICRPLLSPTRPYGPDTPHSGLRVARREFAGPCLRGPGDTRPNRAGECASLSAGRSQRRALRARHLTPAFGVTSGVGFRGRPRVRNTRQPHQAPPTTPTPPGEWSLTIRHPRLHRHPPERHR